MSLLSLIWRLIYVLMRLPPSRILELVHTETVRTRVQRKLAKLYGGNRCGS